MKTPMVMISALLAVAPLPAQEIDDATRAWALKRAYELNGNSMNGCRLRADNEWSCRSIDLSGEIRESQSGPKPLTDPNQFNALDAGANTPPPPAKKSPR